MTHSRLLIASLLVPIIGAGVEPVTASPQARFEALSKIAPRARPDNLRWSPNSKYLAFAWNDPVVGVSWRLVDCASGVVRPAFDPASVAEQLSKLTGKPVTPQRWPFSRVRVLDDGRVRLESDQAAWLIGADGQLTAVPPEKSSPAVTATAPARNAGRSVYASFTRAGEVSPDGRNKVSLSGGNVYLSANAKDARLRPLTTEGTPDNGWVGQASWAPDGQHFALWRERRVSARQYTVTDSVKNTKKDISYEKPGDERTTRTPWVFSLDGRVVLAPTAEVLPASYDTSRLDWSADSTLLRSAFIKRGFTGHGIIEFDVRHGSWRRLLTEEDPKFVYTFGQFFRHDLSDFQTLWTSERTGWLHLYLMDLRTGATIRPITAGDWIMRQVLHVDATAGLVTFVALGRNPGENPYHQHICRIGLDGKGLIDLTPSDATHEAVFAPDRMTFVETASRLDLPPTYTLRSGLDGRAIAVLGSAGSLDGLRKAGWTPTVGFTAKDRDGKYDIWGQVLRPYPFDPKKKYPVLENIYAGPHDSHVPWTFNFWNRTQRELSMAGFYVVKVDGRGTWNRGKEFHQQAWRDLKDGGFADRIAWLKALAAREPSMDLARVGIFGGSAGGQNTAHALLLHDDFYKVGAADCGCYDNRIDKLWWNEQWLGYPVGPWYAENSCATYASRLGGKMLLTVGESDTNVDVRCSYELRDALLAAGKKDLIQFQVVPGANHGAGERDDMREKRVQFFLNVLGSPR